MKKMYWVFLLTCSAILLSGCSLEIQTGTSDSEIEETEKIQKVENVVSIEQEKETTKIETKTSDSKPKEEKKPEKLNNKESEDKKTKKLLEDFGNAFANYSGIQDRNKKLLPLMSEKCAQDNGIYVDDKNGGNMLSSSGRVEKIYYPLDENSNQYSLFLNVKQNNTQTYVLITLKVEENLVSEMTYYTVKKEY